MDNLGLWRALLNARKGMLYLVSDMLSAIDSRGLPIESMMVPDFNGNRYLLLRPEVLDAARRVFREKHIALLDARRFWEMEAQEQRELAARRFAYFSKLEEDTNDSDKQQAGDEAGDLE